MIVLAATLALIGWSAGCDDDDETSATYGQGGTTGGEGGTTTGGEGGTTGAGGALGVGGLRRAPPRDAGGMSFFVTSDKSATGNLGGLAAADARCQTLAEAVGAGDKTWRAYLSTDGGVDGQPVHARNRIGNGPWHNALGELVANDSEELHARTGDAEVFLDERGEKVPGQWPGSPSPNEHDILTGSTASGQALAGKTCADWTSDSPGLTAQVGHSDGLGPGANPDPPYSSWNSSHESQSCSDTAPRGGAGRIYCFAAD